MKLSLFDYNLPKELIATEPAQPRDAARLFVYDRNGKKISHQHFADIGRFLQKGDVLVLNNTKVIPARLTGRLIHSLSASFPQRRESQVLGRKFKILLLEKKKTNLWQCLIDGKGRAEGLKLFFDKKLQGEIVKRVGEGIWEIKFSARGKALDKMIEKLGEMPLPPYIKQDGYRRENKDWYQTVFAKYAGSVAAPTAGLHFTPRLLNDLKKRGVKIEYVTLHVGMGTFLPVKTDKIEDHKMHEESAIVSPVSAKVLNAAKKSGRRIVACGTTAARTLESFAVAGKIKPGQKRTAIFIYPPYEPKFVDALITNFHLPKSTLMMLVSAFLSPGKKTGIKKIQELYAEAISRKYRFYSYGDAMMIV
jgi:S-adenosylmethionine:tRNA ribosyltransferase-isomerase